MTFRGNKCRMVRFFWENGCSWWIVHERKGKSLALGSSFVLVGLSGGSLPMADQRHPHSQMSSVAEGVGHESRPRQNMFYSVELQIGTLERTRLDTDEYHTQAPPVTVIHLKWAFSSASQLLPSGTLSHLWDKLGLLCEQICCWSLIPASLARSGSTNLPFLSQGFVSEFIPREKQKKDDIMSKMVVDE